RGPVAQGAARAGCGLPAGGSARVGASGDGAGSDPAAGSSVARAHARAPRAAHWLPRAAVGYARRHAGAPGAPRVRDGSSFPALLEPRQRAERALVAVVQEAYVQGVSTRRVDELVQARGLQGISKSQVCVLCAELDVEVERFRTRPLASSYPSVWL